jgi:hypothetical protein
MALVQGFEIVDFKFTGYDSDKVMINSIEYPSPPLLLLADSYGCYLFYYLINEDFETSILKEKQEEQVVDNKVMKTVVAVQEGDNLLKPKVDATDKIVEDNKHDQKLDNIPKKEGDDGDKKIEDDGHKKEDDDRLEEEDGHKKEEDNRLDEDDDDKRIEEAYRKKEEEDERRKKEDDDKRKKAVDDDRRKKEDSDRRKKEEDDKQKKEEDDRLKKEEDDKRQKEKDDKHRKEQDDKRKKEEDEKRRKEEADRLKREEEDRLKREEEDRLKREEKDRLKREEEDRLRREEEDRRRKEEERLKQKRLAEENFLNDLVAEIHKQCNLSIKQNSLILNESEKLIKEFHTTMKKKEEELNMVFEKVTKEGTELSGLKNTIDLFPLKQKLQYLYEKKDIILKIKQEIDITATEDNIDLLVCKDFKKQRHDISKLIFRYSKKLEDIKVFYLDFKRLCESCTLEEVNKKLECDNKFGGIFKKFTQKAIGSIKGGVNVQNLNTPNHYQANKESSIYKDVMKYLETQLIDIEDKLAKQGYKLELLKSEIQKGKKPGLSISGVDANVTFNRVEKDLRYLSTNTLENPFLEKQLSQNIINNLPIPILQVVELKGEESLEDLFLGRRVEEGVTDMSVSSSKNYLQDAVRNIKAKISERDMLYEDIKKQELSSINAKEKEIEKLKLENTKKDQAIEGLKKETERLKIARPVVAISTEAKNNDLKDEKSKGVTRDQPDMKESGSDNNENDNKLVETKRMGFTNLANESQVPIKEPEDKPTTMLTFPNRTKDQGEKPITMPIPEKKAEENEIKNPITNPLVKPGSMDIKSMNLLNLGNKTNDEVKPFPLLNLGNKQNEEVKPTTMLNLGNKPNGEVKPFPLLNLGNNKQNGEVNPSPLLNLGIKPSTFPIKTNEQGATNFPIQPQVPSVYSPSKPGVQFGTKAGLQSNLVRLIITYRTQD